MCSCVYWRQMFMCSCAQMFRCSCVHVCSCVDVFRTGSCLHVFMCWCVDCVHVFMIVFMCSQVFMCSGVLTVFLCPCLHVFMCSCVHVFVCSCVHNYACSWLCSCARVDVSAQWHVFIEWNNQLIRSTPITNTWIHEHMNTWTDEHSKNTWTHEQSSWVHLFVTLCSCVQYSCVQVSMCSGSCVHDIVFMYGCVHVFICWCACVHVECVQVFTCWLMCSLLMCSCVAVFMCWCVQCSYCVDSVHVFMCSGVLTVLTLLMQHMNTRTHEHMNTWYVNTWFAGKKKYFLAGSASWKKKHFQAATGCDLQEIPSNDAANPMSLLKNTFTSKTQKTPLRIFFLFFPRPSSVILSLLLWTVNQPEKKYTFCVF